MGVFDLKDIAYHVVGVFPAGPQIGNNARTLGPAAICIQIQKTYCSMQGACQVAMSSLP